MCQADVESARVGTAGPWASFPFAFVPVPIMPLPLAIPQLIGGVLWPKPPYLTSHQPLLLAGWLAAAICTIQHSGKVQWQPAALLGNLLVWVVQCACIMQCITILLCRVMFHKVAKCRGVWYPVHLPCAALTGCIHLSVFVSDSVFGCDGRKTVQSLTCLH